MERCSPLQTLVYTPPHYHTFAMHNVTEPQHPTIYNVTGSNTKLLPIRWSTVAAEDAVHELTPCSPNEWQSSKHSPKPSMCCVSSSRFSVQTNFWVVSLLDFRGVSLLGFRKRSDYIARYVSSVHPVRCHTTEVRLH